MYGVFICRGRGLRVVTRDYSNTICQGRYQGVSTLTDGCSNIISPCLSVPGNRNCDVLLWYNALRLPFITNIQDDCTCYLIISGDARFQQKKTNECQVTQAVIIRLFRYGACVCVYARIYIFVCLYRTLCCKLVLPHGKCVCVQAYTIYYRCWRLTSWYSFICIAI